MGPMIWEVSKGGRLLAADILASVLQLAREQLARFLWLRSIASSSGGKLHSVTRNGGIFEI